MKSRQQFEMKMPSNIALIKYMGKKNSFNNIPSNPSLSYTLPHLTTTVNLSPIDADQDILVLDLEDKKKFIMHLDFLRKHFGVHQFYEILSENNFPSHCGLASSASSFAALTACALKAFGIKDINQEDAAKLSQQGSGSSCRSFFSSWALWDENGVKEITLPYQNLIHHVVVVSTQKKSVSSREAHQRVKSSLLFDDRENRTRTRLHNLIHSLTTKDWEKSYRIVWQEFWDMHALFETCDNFFSYLLPESLSVLKFLHQYWEKNHDGPLVTMDAGPNVHLLFREDQQKIAISIKNYFDEKYLVI
jgi:diphosphomevalonate decarboxylase